MSRLVPLELALKAASAAIAIVGAQCTIFTLPSSTLFYPFQKLDVNNGFIKLFIFHMGMVKVKWGAAIA